MINTKGPNNESIRGVRWYADVPLHHGKFGFVIEKLIVCYGMVGR